MVEGLFEFNGKERDAAVLFNLVDELTYRAVSNVGARAFRQLKKGMMILGRLVPVGELWMVSGNMSVYPSSARSEMLVMAARHSLSNPEAAFRNPAKLAEARKMIAEQHEVFVELFGADIVVVPGTEVQGKVGEFDRHWSERVDPDGEPQLLPRTVVLSEPLAQALRDARP